MKRVGISNFLRFFLYHNDIVATYIDKKQKHLFIPVDLNDLVEREIYPFWALTLKRMVDTVEASHLPDVNKKRIQALFLEGIQSQDLFLLTDSVRKAVQEIMMQDVYPTLFFLRFDRIKDAVTPAFFDNLQGLRDATHQKLAYVFTSYRSLDHLSPTVFPKASLSLFASIMYMKPALHQDMRIIFQTFKGRYNLSLSPAIEEALFRIVSGNVQYLQLALILLGEKKQEISSEEELFTLLSQDERILLQSEELWESLTKDEQAMLLKVAEGEPITEDEAGKGSYLWETGMVGGGEGSRHIFSKLLSHYLLTRSQKQSTDTHTIHFSKKEHLLFTLLQQEVEQICERERIVETVWPEYRELGVSDWAIDRLVARVRSKLKQQKSPYEIITIRTRGYKLTATA
jgi:hypothetical protein